jgi:ABC-type glycerol-3-phosphate transport system permease component
MQSTAVGPVEQLAAPAAAKARKRTRGPFTIGKLLAWLALAGLSVLWLAPLAWMISTSLKTPQDLFGYSWIPDPIAWGNYIDAFSFGMWGRWGINTFVITLISMAGVIFSSAMVAYSFARLRWRARDQVFKLVLATMMLPSVVTLIPQFILFAKLPAFGLQGSEVWVNTFLPLTVPAFTANAFYIFLLRQFMRGIPMELTEAAKIDGASEFRVWRSIIIPLSKPALAAIAIFAFQGAWQDFMGPLIYLQSEQLYTLQIGLRQYEFAFGGSPAWNWLMAASLIVMLPVLLIFLAFQRYFIEGVTITGMGGR